MPDDTAPGPVQASLAPPPTVYAPLYRRLFAMLYDALLLAAALFCVAGAYFTILLALDAGESANLIGSARTGDVVHELEVIEPGAMFYPLMVLVWVGFFVYSWRASGQTLGMRAWKIRLRGKEGKTPALWQLLLRLVAALLSLACAGLGYLVLLLPGVQHSWHDRISGTQVIMAETPG